MTPSRLMMRLQKIEVAGSLTLCRRVKVAKMIKAFKISSWKSDQVIISNPCKCNKKTWESRLSSSSNRSIKTKRWSRSRIFSWAPSRMHPSHRTQNKMKKLKSISRTKKSPLTKTRSCRSMTRGSSKFILKKRTTSPQTKCRMPLWSSQSKTRHRRTSRPLSTICNFQIPMTYSAPSSATWIKASTCCTCATLSRLSLT